METGGHFKNNMDAISTSHFSAIGNFLRPHLCCMAQPRFIGNTGYALGQAAGAAGAAWTAAAAASAAAGVDWPGSDCHHHALHEGVSQAPLQVWGPAFVPSVPF